MSQYYDMTTILVFKVVNINFIDIGKGPFQYLWKFGNFCVFSLGKITIIIKYIFNNFELLIYESITDLGIHSPISYHLILI